MSTKSASNPASAPASPLPYRRDLLVVQSAESTPSDRSIEKRRLRKHFVLNVIRENPGLSRAEIAKSSGFNLPSVSSLVDELIEDGLAYEEEARHVMRGRRPVPVYLKEDAATVLGIDIGKQTTTALLANMTGKTHINIERPTPSLKSPEDYANWVLETANSVLAKAGTETPPLCGIGVVLPGLIASNESPGGTAEEPSTAVRKILMEHFNVEVLVENDARVMVAGLQWFKNSQQRYKNFAVLNLGIGLGLGVCVNGQLLQGESGFAGEIGHVPLGRPGAKCYCGAEGCLETIASGAAISNMAAARGLKNTNVEDVAALARKGDANALAVFDEFAGALGRGIATIIALFNPQAILISGKVSRASDLFLEPMLESARRHALPPSISKVDIVVENPDTNLSSQGAVAMVLCRIYYTNHVTFEEVI